MTTTRITLDSAVETIAAYGFMRACVLASMRRDIDGARVGLEAGGFVVDLRRTVIALRPESILGNGYRREHIAKTAVALLVMADDVGLWQKYAADVAGEGILRAVFTDAAEASSWALRRGRALQQEAGLP